MVLCAFASILGFFLLIWLFMAIYHIICCKPFENDSDNGINRAKETVKNFIVRSSRLYDKAKDKEINQCVICLTEFDSESLIAQLNCSSKHIFHLDCLKQWVEKSE